MTQRNKDLWLYGIVGIAAYFVLWPKTKKCNCGPGGVLGQNVGTIDFDAVLPVEPMLNPTNILNARPGRAKYDWPGEQRTTYFQGYYGTPGYKKKGYAGNKPISFGDPTWTYEESIAMGNGGSLIV